MAFIPAKKSCSCRRPLMSDMNVTPMIDVMLVLLVIFMITAPLLTVGVKVDLPSANAPNIGGNETPIIVYINKDGVVFIGEVEVDAKTLPDKLRAITHESSEDTKIFVKGDKTIPYGTIMEIMGRISSSGFKKVVLVTELPQKQGSNASKKR
ncbi:MAG: protein TolR [Holosporaceae bacterium]|jgi:biopolymer transport protein TolR|nr:protein TolR [Holosporaceae bacterium]